MSNDIPQQSTPPSDQNQNVPPNQPEAQQSPPLKPHRGAVVLVLGILGIAICFILGIIAWVMGNKDLAEIDAGRMDPSGRGITQAGKICGIVGVCLQIAVIVLQLLLGIGFFLASTRTQA